MTIKTLHTLGLLCAMLLITACGDTSNNANTPNSASNGETPDTTPPPPPPTSTPNKSTDPQHIRFTAWVSSTASQVVFDNDETNTYSNQYAFYRTRDVQCDLANYASCASGAMDTWQGMPPATITDTALTLSHPAYYTLVNHDTNQTATLTINPKASNMRDANHKVVAFKDALYRMGGNDIYYENDVWKSENGNDWTLVTASAAFGARGAHQVVAFNDAIYVIGGDQSASSMSRTYTNDVWKSADGKYWEEVTSNATFKPRKYHQVVVFNDAIYVIGGYDEADTQQHDIWRSADGAKWVKVSESAGFGKLASPKVVVLNDSLYIIGVAESGNNHEVWQSENGSDWNIVTDAPGFVLPEGREIYQAIAFKDAIYVMGGRDDGTEYRPDIWSSANGLDWELINDEPAFGARVDFQAVAFKNHMFAIGGEKNGNITNDIWRSADGKDWQLGIEQQFAFPNAEVEPMNGSDANDTLIGDASANTLLGGAGDDVLVGGAGADVLDGGEGRDTISYEGSTERVKVNLRDDGIDGSGYGGDSTGDVIRSIEDFIGSRHDDEVFGNNENNQFVGGAGDDLLHGRGGDDILIGGEGEDTLDGGDGDDVLLGGDGGDVMFGGAGDDVIQTGTGRERVFAGSGNDILDARRPLNPDDYALLDGGDGEDVAYVNGKLEDYELFKIADGYRLENDSEMIDLMDVEKVHFSDGQESKL